MTKYVEVAVNVPRISGVFHYHLPPHLENKIQLGNLIIAPFGKQIIQGVVLRFIDEPEVEDTRPVQGLLDSEISLTIAQIELAKHLAKNNLAPLAACIALMIPPGLSQFTDTLFSLNHNIDDLYLEGNETKNKLIKLLGKKGALRGRQINRAFPKEEWKNIARKLVAKKIFSATPILPPARVRPKYVKTAQLSIPPEEVHPDMENLGNNATTIERRYEVLRFLSEEPIPKDIIWVYAESNANLADLKLLHEKGLIILREELAWRDPLAGLSYDPSSPLNLTIDQKKVWNEIQNGLLEASQGKKIGPFLLHGVTGSGKTEIYLKAVAEVIEHGQQAIVLVPEIALPPQTVRRFMARFPGRVGIMHSRLSEGERYDTWRRARQGKLSVIIGPRSALFTPLPNIALIVVDESHDSSYYQADRLPYFHARHAAVAYAKLLNAVCLLGSATPDLGSYYQADKGNWKLLELPNRILAHQETIQGYREKFDISEEYLPIPNVNAEGRDLPPVKIIDMRLELQSGNRSLFSQTLKKQIAKVLEMNQQAILFLNRRGTATYVFCRDCGHVLTCPRCSMSLTYHSKEKKNLHCHHCGYQRQMEKHCPNCNSERIRQYGTGTEKVEAEVQELFPDARVLRLDQESTSKKGSHEIILNHFTHHRADILVGTQMLAKGLDLPLVTLVGVVLADVGLHLPDYRAGERVFQVLSQVAGRAGRSPLGGQVIMQSFHPDHYLLQAAANHDYAGFVEQELNYRKQLGYPPYSRLLRLLYRHRQEEKAESEALRMTENIRAQINSQNRRATEVIGPAPAFYSKVDGWYRWQIILRGPDPATLLPQHKLSEWQVEVDPQSLL